MSHSFLALGDSYTIGEQVLQEESFPFQTVGLLNQVRAADSESSALFDKPIIIAKTGWTTDELNAAINEAVLNDKYDFVTLLIGVNNQYRGRSVSEYADEFDQLLQRAIGYALDKNKVFVLSIPDWGVTPFAEGRDRKEIEKQIDDYNLAAAAICKKQQIVFIDITTAQRMDGNKEEFLAVDKLHPSGKEYAKWAGRLVKEIKRVM